jgi:hypothetical protein
MLIVATGTPVVVGVMLMEPPEPVTEPVAENDQVPNGKATRSKPLALVVPATAYDTAGVQMLSAVSTAMIVSPAIGVPPTAWTTFTSTLCKVSVTGVALPEGTFTAAGRVAGG